LSTPDNSTVHYLNKNNFSFIYGSNTKLRKPLILRLLKEMTDNNISPDTILQQETCLIPPWNIHNYEIDTSLCAHLKKETPEIIYRNLFNELIHTDNPIHSQIYTDASKTLNGIGLAVIHQNNIQLFQLNSHSSIYTAEYVALLKDYQWNLGQNSSI